MPQAPEPLRLGDAALLGALHGPTELVPVSSSGHTTLIAQLAGLAYSDASSQQRKPLEIALHAGTAVALLLMPPVEGCAGPKGLRGLTFRAAMLAPTALIGLAARDKVRKQLGTTGTISAGLVAGSVAMVAADRSHGSRAVADARIADGLAIGGLQA
ncbi:MAG: undecaprenyl-diphosphate phosphatase, partial [Actinomycetes bacterium]